jgi:histidine triad (HIT) family protein
MIWSMPTYLGYVMAETKRHAPSFEDLTDAEAQALGLLVARLSRALRVCIGAEHIYAFKYGDHVPHIHIHIAGRYPEAPKGYWGVRVDEWPAAPHGGVEEIAALCEQLRAYLRGAL